MALKMETSVLCPLSDLQKYLYSYVIKNNIAVLQDMPSDDSEDSEERLKGNDNDDMAPYITRLTNMQRTMMMFKKVVDHPYLLHFPLDPSKKKGEPLINEDLVSSSGKMVVMDLMLTRLKEQGHKVVIFSTLFTMVDFLEDYMVLRKHTYRRLTGHENLQEKVTISAEFNNDPNILVFLLCARTGGLGVNLASADTVIFFDSDWNPQANMQIRDRCRRIGQIEPVLIYSLFSRNTIDDKITCGMYKCLLEDMVIQGEFTTLSQADRKHFLDFLIKESYMHRRYGSSELPNLDRLLDRSDLYNFMPNPKK